MKCPVCKEVDLVMAERQGVEIDRCPVCGGIWFDRRVYWTDVSANTTQQSEAPRDKKCAGTR
jgi:uncharacterized protein